LRKGASSPASLLEDLHYDTTSGPRGREARWTALENLTAEERVEAALDSCCKAGRILDAGNVPCGDAFSAASSHVQKWKDLLNRESWSSGPYPENGQDDLKKNQETVIRESAVLSRARDYLGLERNIAVMMIAGIVPLFGSALWVGYFPKLLQILGASGVMIGLFNTMGALLWIGFPYVGGGLSDRMGRGRVLILTSVLAAAGYVIYAVARVWWAFIPGMILLTAGGSFRFMGSLAMIGDRLDAKRRTVSMAVRGLAGSVPGVLMPPLGGALILWLGLVSGVRIGVIATLVLTVAVIWIQHRFYRIPQHGKSPKPLHLRQAWRAMNADLKRLLVANCLVSFGAGMSGVFAVLYVLNQIGCSALEFGIFQAVATASCAVLGVPAAKLADRHGTNSRWPFVGGAFCLRAVFPLILVFAPSTVWLYPVFAVRGITEVGDIARKALIVDLAQGANSGSIIGTYFLIIGACAFPAPLIGGWLWEWMPRAPFVAGAAISGLGLVCFMLQRKAKAA